MDYTILAKKLYLLKTNPSLAETMPQADILALITEVFSAFRALQTSIESGRLQGETGLAGATPRAGIDYPSFSSFDATIQAKNKEIDAKLVKFENELSQKLSSLKDGKDAEITASLITQIAELASSMIDVPDVATTITAEPGAIRNALELLDGDDRLDRSAIRGIDELEQALLAKIATATANRSAGGIGRGVVAEMIAAIPTAIGTGHTIEDEGTALTARTSLNFVGAGVTVTDTGSKTLVTIPSGSTWAIPTETPNGTITVFTFSTVPKLIITNIGASVNGNGCTVVGNVATMDFAPTFIYALIT